MGRGLGTNKEHEVASWEASHIMQEVQVPMDSESYKYRV